MQKPVAVIATIVLVVALIPVLVMSWAAIRSLLGNGTLVAIITLAIVGLAVGHMLGGPVENNRTVLALATSTRHPAVAMTIAAATFPNEKLVLAAILLDLIVCAIVSAPYVQWRKRGVRAGSYDLGSGSYAGRRAAPAHPHVGPLRRLTDRRR
jgi:BASS family bile acid:Na+ symporter